MYSFLRRPIWVLSHVLVALLVVVLISLGFWQRSRYFEERTKKDLLEEEAKARPQALEDIVAANTKPSDVPSSAAYERVKVTGTYDVDHEVIIANRSLDGAPGAWVLTPLVRSDGTAVPVVRGWIPFAMAEEGLPLNKAVPPTGEVTVLGNVQLTQVRSSFGTTDAANGVLDQLSRVDLARFAKQLPYAIEPVWVLLDTQTPAQPGDYPSLVELQTRDPSQNFSYMLQWWAFALIAVVGYPIILRAVARSKSGEGKRKRRDRVDDEIPWAPGLEPDESAEVGG